jgi:integrase
VVLPTIHRKKVVPWTAEMVAGMRAALPERLAALVDVGAGLGLRQGEIFGLSPDDVEWLSPEPFVRVDRQLKVLRGGLVLDLPKGRKTRTVPLPESVQVALAEHMRLHPPVTVALPWQAKDGSPTTVRLFFNDGGKPIHRADFNPGTWKPALVKAGISPERKNGMHALRHYFASVLLTEGESIQAVSAWLGHHDPTVTLKIYAHLMPKSETRMRKILDRAMTNTEQPQARSDHGDHR